MYNYTLCIAVSYKKEKKLSMLDVLFQSFTLYDHPANNATTAHET